MSGCMGAPIATNVDYSVINAMRLRRRLLDREAPHKRDLLRRLYRQYVLCNLPEQAESRVEQSFNERLFAEIFDYRTLLSHVGPYHMQPKNWTGKGHFDDFSLGEFSKGNEKVIVSAELKGPAADLDAPQAHDRKKRTPVQQAIETATAHGARWAIVSNFRLLRLYNVARPTSWLAEANLHEVQSANDLALLCAHFDRCSLLPRKGLESEMEIAQIENHPAHPVAADPERYRVVLRFVPRLEQELPLYKVEGALRDVLLAETYPPFIRKGEFDSGRYVAPFELKDGWIGIVASDQAAGTQWKLAVSVLGEIQLSSSHKFKFNPRGIDGDILLLAIRTFAERMRQIYEKLALTVAGRVGFELRDAQDASLMISVGGNGYVSGKCATSDIIGADFDCAMPGQPVRDVLVHCASELAIYFRRENGEGLRFRQETLT